MKISDYYAKQDWYKVPYHKKVYPVVMVKDDMGELDREPTQKGKRACRAYVSESQNFPEEILASIANGRRTGVFLSIWV